MCLPGLQAVRDAAEAAEAQAHWLRTALPNYFTQKLLHQVRNGKGVAVQLDL